MVGGQGVAHGGGQGGLSPRLEGHGEPLEALVVGDQHDGGGALGAGDAGEEDDPVRLRLLAAQLQRVGVQRIQAQGAAAPGRQLVRPAGLRLVHVLHVAEGAGELVQLQDSGVMFQGQLGGGMVPEGTGTFWNSRLSR